MSKLKLRQRIHFLQQFIKNPARVGAIMPSSRWLARAMIKAASMHNPTVIVELGAGQGVLTKQLLSHLQPGTRLLVLEIEDAFVKKLQDTISHPQVEIICDSAEHLEDILAVRGFQKADYIFSGLPFNAFTKKLSTAILQAVYDILSDNGSFVAFQYTSFQEKLFRSIFPRVSIAAFEARNIPPALVYVCGR